MSSAEITAEEMFESLNGFEEIAIKRSFGCPIGDLRNDQTQFLRALVFVNEKRGGLKDPQAYEAAQMLPLMQVVDGYFPPDEEEAMPEEPDTESGKDDSLSA